MAKSASPDITLAAAMLHGFQARGAEAVDLHAGGGLGVAGGQHGGAGDVGALLAHRRVTQPRITSSTMGGVQIVAVAQGLQHLGGQAEAR